MLIFKIFTGLCSPFMEKWNLILHKIQGVDIVRMYVLHRITAASSITAAFLVEWNSIVFAQFSVIWAFFEEFYAGSTVMNFVYWFVGSYITQANICFIEFYNISESFNWYFQWMFSCSLFKLIYLILLSISNLHMRTFELAVFGCYINRYNR